MRSTQSSTRGTRFAKPVASAKLTWRAATCHYPANLCALRDSRAYPCPRHHNPASGAPRAARTFQALHSCPESVHCLCKACNPDLNARHPARSAPTAIPVAPASTRAALPAVLAAHFGTASPGSAEGIGVGPVEPPSPSPASMACCRRRAPRPRQIAERQPRTPIRRWPPFASPRHAPNPAKTHPASPQEFFGKNS